MNSGALPQPECANWNSGMMEYWSNGLRRRKELNRFAAPHYCVMPSLRAFRKLNHLHEA
jgi:hypothetical protein